MSAVFAAIEFAPKVAADWPSGLAAAEFATSVAAVIGPAPNSLKQLALWHCLALQTHPCLSSLDL
jgi:hypothetical protein